MKYIVILSALLLSITHTSLAGTITSIQLGNKTKIVELENGKKVALLSMGPFYFKNGDPPALVLKYETKIELSNYEALKAEVDEIWKIFKHNVKTSGFSTAAIRAQRPLKGNYIRKGQGYGFVFLKQPDGSWKHME